MVKKRVGGAHRYKAVTKATHAATASAAKQHQQPDDPQGQGPKPPSHLQRKITKKAKFYEKVLSQSAPKAPQGVLKKKKKAGRTLASLESLAAELEQVASLQTAGNSHHHQQQQLGKGSTSSIKRSKARLAVTVAETQRLHRVMQHPTYKADPVQAITNHLMNTLPAAAPAKQQQQREQKGVAGKKRKKKGSSGMSDMQQ